MDGSTSTQEHLEEIALERIDPSPTNPRKRFDPAKLQELADSIATKGLISPVVLRPLTGTRYELVVGERRYRASKLAGRTTILALVRTLTDREVAELQLEENGQREEGTREAVRLARRRAPVRATRLPGSERERAFRLVVQLLDQAVDDMVHDRGIGDG